MGASLITFSRSRSQWIREIGKSLDYSFNGRYWPTRYFRWLNREVFLMLSRIISAIRHRDFYDCCICHSLSREICWRTKPAGIDEQKKSDSLHLQLVQYQLRTNRNKRKFKRFIFKCWLIFFWWFQVFVRRIFVPRSLSFLICLLSIERRNFWLDPTHCRTPSLIKNFWCGGKRKREKKILYTFLISTTNDIMHK